ncbi:MULTISPECIES: hypothetical protein [Streptomyces violaceusniger group]|uniref:Uncharacterized protein n=1 Tax=Streptomyces malaysiensis subsp. samsunensis TaxID=459658 RepID=A0A9X2LT15_STRMQ|nr:MULTISPECIES: hypothetical protein [Streptomyces]MCQ8829835.1 hypothetical protein [Streptomyces samsunensis]
MSETDTPYGTPFGDLLRAANDAGHSYRKLAESAVDPTTGVAVKYATLYRIARDEPIMLGPGVVGAVAAAIRSAIDVDERDVRKAAAQQYCGLIADDPFNASDGETSVVVVHAPGMGRKDMPRVEELLRRYAAGELPPELSGENETSS